jgi:3-phosphoshikimate 1-carboxyvinyltransferase
LAEQVLEIKYVLYLQSQSMKNSQTHKEGRSPWSMNDYSLAKIEVSSRPERVNLSLPGSKSFTNRALIIASIANGTSSLLDPLFSDDTYWCMNAIQSLGAKVQFNHEKKLITVTNSNKAKDELIIQNKNVFIGSAGTTARFLPGVIAGSQSGLITLDASNQLSKRPLEDLITALNFLGVQIHCLSHDKSFPMTITGNSLIGGKTQISGEVSSQFMSGLLIAAPLAKSTVTIDLLDSVVQPDYIRITIQMMKDFGIQVDVNESFTQFIIEPQLYIARDSYALEADASTATYFFALAACTNREIIINNLNSQTLQPDLIFIKHLEKMGCEVKFEGANISVTGPKKLKGGFVFDLSDCSDCTPALSVIAPFANDKIEIRGVAHIRTHECDRLHVLSENLLKCGVSVEEHHDGLTIYPIPDLPKFAKLETYDDHRIAMAFSILAAAGTGAEIIDPACVSKTCSNFFELLEQCGVSSYMS